LKAKELLNRPIEEIAKYFKDQARTRGVNENLGLDIYVIFDFRYRPFRFDSILKKGEMIVLTGNNYTIYTRGDDYTYIRLRVRYSAGPDVIIDIATCEYVSGKIIDRRRYQIDS
jgi:hypothetical protein